MVTIAAPSDPDPCDGLFARHLEEIGTKGEVEVVLAGRAVSDQPRLRRRPRGAQAAGSPPRPAQGVADLSFADRRHRRYRECEPHLRRRQASEKLRLAGRRRPPVEPSQRRHLCRKRDPRLGRALSRHGGGRARPARRIRRGGCSRNAARPLPAAGHGRAAIVSWRTSRPTSAASTAVPVLTIWCWPGSAPARR